jgi:uncharacterized membrane protein YhaH (DUF805 family)
MDWVWFLFGFDGRINRAKMWLAILVIICWMLFIGMLMLSIDRMFGSAVKSIHFGINDIFGLVDPAVLRATFAHLRSGKETSPAHLILMFFEGVGSLIFVWVYLATSVKRLHDRDKTGWWMVPYFVIPGLYAQFQNRLPDSYLIFPLALAVCFMMIWGFIDMYCLRGTRWTNQFGPNPLPKTQGRPRTTSASRWDQTSAYEFVPHSASSSASVHVNRGHD